MYISADDIFNFFFLFKVHDMSNLFSGKYKKIKINLSSAEDSDNGLRTGYL